jgi:hypothetical protein
MFIRFLHPRAKIDEIMFMACVPATRNLGMYMARSSPKCQLSESDEKLIHEAATCIEDILDKLVAVESTGESCRLFSMLARIAAAASTELKGSCPDGEERPSLIELMRDIDFSAEDDSAGCR